MRCSGFVLRGHIGRENQLWKKSVQKIPLFILKHLLNLVVTMDLNGSVLSVIGERQFWKKSGKKFLGFIFGHLLSPVFARAFSNGNLPVIGRHGYLDKNVQKIPWFCFLRCVKPSIYKDFFKHQSCGNRGHMDGKIKVVKKSPKSSPLKKICALNPVNIRVLAVALSTSIGETRMF